MKPILTLFTALLLAPLAALHAADSAKPAAKPNIVYMLADDLGWGDLSANGGSFPTPQLDRLFAQGVRLDNFMGWCVCSPMRVMLLTGRHPFRVGTGPGGGRVPSHRQSAATAAKRLAASAKMAPAGQRRQQRKTRGQQ